MNRKDRESIFKAFDSSRFFGKGRFLKARLEITNPDSAILHISVDMAKHEEMESSRLDARRRTRHSDYWKRGFQSPEELSRKDLLGEIDTAYRKAVEWANRELEKRDMDVTRLSKELDAEGNFQPCPNCDHITDGPKCLNCGRPLPNFEARL